MGNQQQPAEPFEAFGRVYFPIGYKFTCPSGYAGCPGEIVEVLSLHHADSHYRVKIDATGHPEAYDENGDPEPVKFHIFHHQEIAKAIGK